MSLGLFHDTVAAISTPGGTSALAVVRISGPDAIGISGRIIRDKDSLLVCRSSSSVYTEILSGEKLIDDVVILVHRAPRSFTSEDLCEITSHGSPVIAREILSMLISNGARQAEPGEFSRRAFFNGKIGIEDAQLISIKAEAQSDRELRGAERAIHEKFERLHFAYESLIGIIALVDAEIDFGESDDIQVSGFEARLSSVRDILSSLVQGSANRSLNAGFYSVALVGPPNVGKSSIFNALLSYERSLVSEIPGTTRDYVEAFIDVGGFRVKLIDTAGDREAEEILESRGIELGRAASVRADISLRVTDPSNRAPEDDGELLLHNKIDLDGWSEGLSISAKTGAGIPDLHAWLAGRLGERASEFSQVSLSQSERGTLVSILEKLDRLSLELEPAILSEELRLISSDLSKLLGMNVSADSLDYIFSRMCIGK